MTRATPDDRAYRTRGRLVFLAFAVGALLLYAPILNAWFQEDDFDLLYGVASGGPFGRWTLAPSGFFRPLVSVSLWLQHSIWGLNPIPYRIFNELIHAGVAAALVLLVFEVLRDRIAQSTAWRTALATGTLFLVSPSHVEAVAWVAARTDLLSALFGLLSLTAFVRFCRLSRQADFLQSLLFFALGILCKESILLVPVLCGVYSALFSGKEVRRLAALGFAAVAMGYGVLRIFLIGAELNGNLNRSTGFKAIGSTMAQLARSILPGLPFGNPDLNNSETLRTSAGLAYLAIGLTILIVSGIWAARRFPDRRVFVFWASAMACALLPAVGLSVRLFRSQGERFVYFPSAFVLAWIVSAAVASGRSESRKPSLGIAACALAAIVALQVQLGYWRQGAALSERVQRSFIADIVQRLPQERANVVLLDVPYCVQGAYGVGYVFETVAPLFVPGHHPKVDVVTMFSLRAPEHRVQFTETGDRVTIRLREGGARFSLEATQTGRTIDTDRISDAGYDKFEPEEVVFNLATLAPDSVVFAWDGIKFVPYPLPLVQW